MRPSVRVAIFLSLETGREGQQAAAEKYEISGVVLQLVRAEQLATWVHGLPANQWLC